MQGQLNDDGTVMVRTQRCIKCGASTLLRVLPENVEDYNAGKFAQDVWPSWSTDKRELVISGMHAFCWYEVFSYDEEYEASDETIGMVQSYNTWVQSEQYQDWLEMKETADGV